MSSKKIQKTKTEQLASKMYLFILVPFVIFVILAAVILIAKANILSDKDVVAKINEYEITAKELKASMSRQKVNAMSAFKDKYNVDIAGKDWTKEIKGVVPNDFWRNYSLAELTRYKIEQSLGVKYKIIDKESTDYESFLEAFEKENADRLQKQANGEVVYGARQYTLNSYYSYSFSNLSIKIKDAMSKEGQPLYVNEKLLKEWYNSVKSEKYPKQATMTFKGYYLYYEGNEQSKGYTQDGALKIMNDVKKALDEGKNDTYIKDICKDIVIKKLELNDDNASSVQKSAINTYEAAKEMKKGDISKVVNDNFSYTILKCNSKKDAGYKDFSEYKDPINSEYISEKYEVYVKHLVEKAKVEKFKKYNLVK